MNELKVISKHLLQNNQTKALQYFYSQPKPSINSYTKLLSHFSKSKDHQQINQLHSHFLKSNHRPTLGYLTALIQANGYIKQWNAIWPLYLESQHPYFEYEWRQTDQSVLLCCLFDAMGHAAKYSDGKWLGEKVPSVWSQLKEKNIHTLTMKQVNVYNSYLEALMRVYYHDSRQRSLYFDSCLKEMNEQNIKYDYKIKYILKWHHQRLK